MVLPCVCESPPHRPSRSVHEPSHIPVTLWRNSYSSLSNNLTAAFKWFTTTGNFMFKRWSEWQTVINTKKDELTAILLISPCCFHIIIYIFHGVWTYHKILNRVMYYTCHVWFRTVTSDGAEESHSHMEARRYNVRQQGLLLKPAYGVFYQPGEMLTEWMPSTILVP